MSSETSQSTFANLTRDELRLKKVVSKPGTKGIEARDKKIKYLEDEVKRSVEIPAFINYI